jgi:hypothetical protein
MIRTKIDELIELALWSVYRQRKASFIITSSAARIAKSAYSYAKNPGIVVFSDCTAVGIVNGYGTDRKR